MNTNWQQMSLPFEVKTTRNEDTMLCQYVLDHVKSTWTLFATITVKPKMSHSFGLSYFPTCCIINKLFKNIIWTSDVSSNHIPLENVSYIQTLVYQLHLLLSRYSLSQVLLILIVKNNQLQEIILVFSK